MTGHPGGGPRGLEPGQGTTYRTALSQVLSDPASVGVDPTTLNGARVLIVDDSWVARRSLAKLLIPHGCIVSDARDTASARQLLSRRPVDVILLDLLLPGENGLQFCAKLREEGVTQRVAVVVVSGVSTSDNVVQAINAGASFFLVKPVSETYLLRVLSGVLRQYRTQQMRSAASLEPPEPPQS